MTLALFDFDGTIIRKDSLPDFIQFAVGRRKYYAGLATMAPMLCAFKLKLIPNGSAKERFLGHYFSGWGIDHFESIAQDYGKRRIDRLVRRQAQDKMDWHLDQGHTVAVVSASIDRWIQPWSQPLGLTLIATGLEEINGQLSGRFSTPNCHGPEKVVRVRAQYDLDQFEQIYAYGDSAGDREMLAIATHPFYRKF